MNNMLLGDRYEIIEKIGEGGMSEVYKARCTKLNRFVAVKILKKEFCDNTDISNKFRKEAAALAKLSESNIVNVLDVGSEDGVEYFVMEFVDGKTLKEVIKYHGKLSYQTAIKVSLQMAKALDCAHRNNIIHRDVKPQNVLVTESGEVKITDFGIAKNTTQSTITNTQTIVGSAHYFSPEQAKGSFIDCRTDIYSLGVVMYEMVTGVLPFDGESPVTIALKHIQEEPIAPKNISASIPESLNKIILKCMQKDATARYASMKELIQDLQKVQDNPDIVINNFDENKGDDHTIVMAPVVPPTTPRNTSLEDDYYEDDEDDFEDEDEDDFEDDKPLIKMTPKKKKALIGGGVTIGIILLFMVGFFIFGGSSKVKEVEIPKIVGLSNKEAKKKIEELNLVYREEKAEESDKEEGTILSVNPSEGTKVAEGSEVKVTVSAGEETIEMLNIKDYTEKGASDALVSAGFDVSNIKFIKQESDDVEVGKVISTNPKEKTKVSKKSSIEVFISTGPKIELVKVPNNLNGKTEAEAKKELENLGLVVHVNYEDVSESSKDGVVIKTSNADANLQKGAEVSITVGVLKLDSSLFVKKGITYAEAKSMLAQANSKYGFQVTFKTSGDMDESAKVSEFENVKVGKNGSISITLKADEKPEKPEKPEVPVGEQ